MLRWTQDPNGHAWSHMQLAEQLQELERSLQLRAVRSDAQKLDEILADDFREFGVSGGVWSKHAVIEALRVETFSERRVSEFKLTLLAEDVALVTYRCERMASEQRPAAKSLRCSIWRRRDSRWQMLFHQATPA
jgi:hypothetical protein